jgi:hypothetical protein
MGDVVQFLVWPFHLPFSTFCIYSSMMISLLLYFAIILLVPPLPLQLKERERREEK